MIPIAFAVLAGLFWGIGELCAKSALKSHEIGPLTAIAVRTVVALPIMLVFASLQRFIVGGLTSGAVKE